MVPTDSVINFRWKNLKDFEKFPFAGTSATVKELKTFLNQKHKFDQQSSRPDKSQAPSEITVKNVATGEFYTIDDTDIPKGTEVEVARKLAGGENSDVFVEPVEDPVPDVKPKKPLNRSASDQTLTDQNFYKHLDFNVHQNAAQGLNDPIFIEHEFHTRISKDTDISALSDPENVRILAVMYQAMLFYDHTARYSNRQQKSYPKVNTQGNVDYGQNNIPRRTTARAPAVTATSKTVNPAAYAAVPVDNAEHEDVPQWMRCNICQSLLRDAVSIPCLCSNVFYCASCIQDTLLNDPDSACPTCHTTGISPDACKEETYMRDVVNKWEREMPNRLQKKKEVPAVISTIKEEPKVQIKQEPSTPPVSSAPKTYTKQHPVATVKSEPIGSNKDHHSADGKSQAPMPIGSLVSGARANISAAMFQQPEAPNRRTTFPPNSSMFMGGASARGPRPNLSHMAAYYGSQFPDGSAATFGAYNMGTRFPAGAMDPAAYGLRNRMSAPYAAAALAAMRQFAPYLPNPNQSVDMFEGRLAGRYPGPGMLPTGQTLRITRVPNQPKIPVQSPYDLERRTPEKSRSDDYRRDREDDYRRDKEDGRRRGDLKSDERKYDPKYDDRKERRSDHDERRSPERRRSRENRSRADSPDRRDGKKREPSRSDLRSSDDRRSLEKDRLDYKKDRRREDSPPLSKGKPIEKMERRTDLSPRLKVEAPPKERDVDVSPLKEIPKDRDVESQREKIAVKMEPLRELPPVKDVDQKEKAGEMRTTPANSIDDVLRPLAKEIVEKKGISPEKPAPVPEPEAVVHKEHVSHKSSKSSKRKKSSREKRERSESSDKVSRKKDGKSEHRFTEESKPLEKEKKSSKDKTVSKVEEQEVLKAPEEKKEKTSEKEKRHRSKSKKERDPSKPQREKRPHSQSVDKADSKKKKVEFSEEKKRDSKKAEIMEDDKKQREIKKTTEMDAEMSNEPKKASKSFFQGLKDKGFIDPAAHDVVNDPPAEVRPHKSRKHKDKSREKRSRTSVDGKSARKEDSGQFDARTVLDELKQDRGEESSRSPHQRSLKRDISAEESLETKKGEKRHKSSKSRRDKSSKSSRDKHSRTADPEKKKHKSSKRHKKSSKKTIAPGTAAEDDDGET